VAQILKRRGYDVVIANNGQIALEQIKKKCFDIALMDLKYL